MSSLLTNPIEPTVAVIIPCYNAERTLARTIENALSQQDARVDIVVIDDGSTDDSLAIARGFEPLLRVFTKPHRGVSPARNEGIAETTGEWLVFLDADDLLLPDTLVRRLDTGSATGADVIVCDWQELSDQGVSFADGQVRSIDWNQMQSGAEIACAKGVWAPTAALMYRRALVQKIRGFREDLPIIQDARFMFDAAYHGAHFAHSPHIGACYHVAPGSLSRRDPGRFWDDVLTNGRQIEALWRARGALSPEQRETLHGIYNGAAHGTFRAGHPAFREALAALRASLLPISGRNRLAELMTDVFGRAHAARAAATWTKLRRAFVHAGSGSRASKESLL